MPEGEEEKASEAASATESAASESGKAAVSSGSRFTDEDRTTVMGWIKEALAEGGGTNHSAGAPSTRLDIEREAERLVEVATATLVANREKKEKEDAEAKAKEKKEKEGEEKEEIIPRKLRRSTRLMWGSSE